MPLTGSSVSSLAPSGQIESIKAVADATDTHAVLVDGRANNGANDGIESGGIAAAADDTDRAHGFISIPSQKVIDKFRGLHELADVTQDTREEVESEEDSE